jgi:signal transduction histidine kinase
VDALEGSLTVASTPEGTTVSIRIPTTARDLTEVRT